jgi:hypothetical protein
MTARGTQDGLLFRMSRKTLAASPGIALREGGKALDYHVKITKKRRKKLRFGGRT